jgi:hypothetical protein
VSNCVTKALSPVPVEIWVIENQECSVLFKEVKCCENYVRALVDPGSGVSAISEDFANRVRAQRLGWKGPCLRLACGEIVLPEAAIRIVVEERGVRAQTSAVVPSKLCCDVLLGNDLLHQLSHSNLCNW